MPTKGGAWTVCIFQGELDEKEGVAFKGGLIPQCTLLEHLPSNSQALLLNLQYVHGSRYMYMDLDVEKMQLQ